MHRRTGKSSFLLNSSMYGTASVWSTATVTTSSRSSKTDEHGIRSGSSSIIAAHVVVGNAVGISTT
eukprot:CAMPEP_0178551896 /NCGR_PEP_ID=MMETSP0697-20121206/7018_1 /TAXON_ID=265572 /ORGANISM="Extubocellulus spinifer, Strain CCMP396" /LENGTH=65 /DNA_ID=CAMNT_0020184757 /DNA_START=1200 /DNA_END=1397 /DNA_ORIENTATION=+